MVLGCQNNDLNELYLYFSTGKDLSSYVWENYNFFDLWNAVENGATPPERNPCNSSYIASVRSCTLAVLGNFTTINDFVGFNRDFYNLYLLIIGQEPIITPSFNSDCVARLYSVFSIGLTGKWRQPQDLTAVLSKSAALAFVQYQQPQNFDALISKSAALDQVQFLQGQEFNVELLTYAYLLDDYPGAAAAYSVRLLSSSYSGALVRIRRSSDNQEKDFLPDTNNELSLNSSALIGGQTLGNFVGANDGFVVTWYDQTLNSLGLDLEQSSASSQPQIIFSGSLNVLNSKASLNFDGSNWMNTISLDVADGIAQPWSVTHIGKSNTLAPDGFDGIWANQNLEARLIFDNSTPKNYLIQCGFNGFDGNVDTNQHVFNTIFDFPNTIAKFYKDNSEETLSATSPDNRAFRGLTLGALTSSGVLASNYQFQEVILYPNELSNINGINTNINDFYNIY